MKRMKQGIMLLLILISILVLCGCSANDDVSKGKIVCESELLSDIEGKLPEANSGELIKLDNRDYDTFVHKLKAESSLSETEYDESLGVFVYSNAVDEYQYYPVFANVMDGSALDCDNLDDNMIFLPSTVKTDVDTERSALYICYDKRKDGSYENLGTVFLGISIKETGRNYELGNNEAYDLINGVFDFYPIGTVSVEGYNVAIECNMEENSYRIADHAFDEDVIVLEEPFVEHEINPGIIDNGYTWEMKVMEREISSPVRIRPWIVLYSNPGSRENSNVDFSVQKLVLKKGTNKIESCNNICVLPCSFRNHQIK